MGLRGTSLAALAPLFLGSGCAGGQAARLLRYKPVSNLSHRTELNEDGVKRTLVQTIDSSEAVPGRDVIAFKWRGGDISSKSHLRFEPYRLTSRGGIPRPTGPDDTELPPQLAKLVRTHKTAISERSIRGGSRGFPLLPEREVRPGGKWRETYVMGMGLGEGFWIIPVKATYRYLADRTVQGRECAILSFELSGELLFGELPLPGAREHRGAKRTIETRGELTFDYENGCDVRLQMKTVERDIMGRRREPPRERTWTVLKTLSETPLLGPRPSAPEGVLGVIAGLSHPEREVRSRARYFLRENPTDPEVAVPALVRLLHHENERVRSYAADVLGHYGKEVGRALPQLSEVLETTADPNIQESIIDRLVDLGDDAKPAIPALAKVIVDEKGNVSKSAIGLLGSFGPDSAVAVPNLVKVAKMYEPHSRHRFACISAVHALELIGPKARSALPVLEQLRRAKWSSMRNQARQAIRRIRAEEPRTKPAQDKPVATKPPAPGTPSIPAVLSRDAPTLTFDLGGGVTMEFVLIPAGEFMMGSPATEAKRQESEGPQHRVKITRAFYMGRHEVTQAQYERVMGKNPSRFKWAKMPVDMVSWDNAAEFCRKLSKRTGKTVRLPTEAEWEYACRAGSTTRFCFGDNGNELGGYDWYGINSENRTHVVGSKRANAWGLHDMHGNIGEWCGDWYGEYPSGTATDPTGPGKGTFRVIRGGNWESYNFHCRSAMRSYFVPTGRHYYWGFRVAVTVAGR